jgi:hypothetical protein
MADYTSHKFNTSVSLTQVSNISGVILSLGLIFDVDLDEGTVTEVVNAALLLTALAASFYGRWRKGDLNIFGFRK